MHAGSFVNDLAIVLGVAAFTFMLFKRLGQPAVLGYLMAGLIVGPYIPIPLFADPARIHALSEFGVVLVMFAIGLEFRIARLLRVLPVSGATASMQIGLLLSLGFMAGQALGWTTVQSLFLGASLAISSTMLVSAVFEERRVADDVREMVLGILVLQDVAAIALIATMTVVGGGGALSAGGLAITLGRLLLVLLLLLAAGLFVVPRAISALVRLGSSEALVVGATGLCFTMAALATSLGYSVALGAFVAGILVAESGHGEMVEHAIAPLKSFFSAIFFVSIGMTVDPRLALSHAGAALLVSALVVVGQLLSVTLGGLLSGNGLRKSLGAGLALGQIGEFAFIIVGIAQATGVAPEALSPIVVSTAVITAFTTPMAIGNASRLIGVVDRLLPARLQNLLVVYEVWFARIRATRAEQVGPTPARAAGRAVALDGLCLLALIGVWYLQWDALTTRIQRLLTSWELSSSPVTAGHVAGAGMVVLALPVLYHLLHNTDRLARTAVRNLFDGPDIPSGSQNGSARTDDTALLLDRSDAEGLLLTVFRITALLAIGLPATAMSRALFGSPLVGAAMLLLSIPLVRRSWRAAGKLDTTIRSTTQSALAILGRQRASESPATGPSRTHATAPGGGRAGPGPAPTRADPFAGHDGLHHCHLTADAAAVGQTLAGLDLRARTGAAVLAVHRTGHDVLIPTGSEPLHAGDVLVLAGTPASIDAARSLLMASRDGSRSAGA